MTMRTDTASGPSLEALYGEVQHFYARHMQLLDSGAAEEWARGFTEDGAFWAPTLPEPARGRAVLAGGVRKTAAELAEAGETHRHLISMLSVTPEEDGSLRVRSYAQVIATAKGGEPRLYRMCVCDDVLVRDGGELLISERRVTRDDMP
ncbi:nuclear transport factor 2 family protein [Nonomuraea sp. NPDC046570]|uniref:nuclear transport factor 2 family protein n=1 Tax=Nonomuraea sp. NPDC046570 TaxID=3155255 RepID=UPI0033F88498